jgi:phage terminase large subunit
MKSHFLAGKLIERCLTKRTRWVCIREVQASLRESVRQLLMDKIIEFGLSDKFQVLDTEIRCPHGGLIIFKGMQTYNATNIKSLEAYDGAWVEEAQTFSALSLRLLRATIRKAGSEMWFSWNPRFETDPVDAFFRGQRPPASAIIIQTGWEDNPWLSAEAIAEKDHDYATDPEMADHVWGGGYEIISAGAYFAKHLQALETAGRVGNYPHIPGLPVFTSWDLGVDDYTSIWFFQVVGPNTDEPRVRIIDFYESDGIGAEQILASGLPEYTTDMQERIEAMLLLGRDARLSYARHFLPHDIKVREWGNGARTRVQTLVKLGVPQSSISVGAAQNDEERINAIRQLLPMCEFNATSRVRLGLTHLRRYSRKMNEHLGIYLGPLHDEHSHASEAFGEFAANCGLTLREWPKMTELETGEPAPQHTMRIPPPPPASAARRTPL